MHLSPCRYQLYLPACFGFGPGSWSGPGFGGGSCPGFGGGSGGGSGTPGYALRGCLYRCPRRLRPGDNFLNHPRQQPHLHCLSSYLGHHDHNHDCVILSSCFPSQFRCPTLLESQIRNHLGSTVVAASCSMPGYAVAVGDDVVLVPASHAGARREADAALGPHALSSRSQKSNVQRCRFRCLDSDPRYGPYIGTCGTGADASLGSS